MKINWFCPLPPARTSIADDYLAGMDADAVLNGLADFGRELVIQLGDVRLDQ